LEWAAREGRVLLTHDANTITAFAYDRIAHGLPMPGVFEVSLRIPISIAIEEILLLAACWRRAVSQANGRDRSITYRLSRANDFAES
jgi:hypothetical protein